MQIETISEVALEDGATELFIQTNAKELQLLGYILEAFEGYCYYTTVDRDRMLIKIIIPKDFRQEVGEIIVFLRKSVSWEMD